MTSGEGGARVAGRATLGPSSIIAATAIGGGAGYLLVSVAGAVLGPAAYAPFAVFWSSLYLVVGGLSGIQQEVARGTRPAQLGPRRPVARNFAIGGAAVVAFLAATTLPLWSGILSPHGGWLLCFPLIFGVTSYVFTAVISGVVHGLHEWSIVAAMIAADGVLRLVLAGAALVFTHDLVVVVWAVVVPFFLAPGLIWLFFRHRIVGRAELDVGYRDLAWNITRTLLGSISAGILISGFPALLGATSPGVSAARLAALVLAINLARAPLVVVVLSLQGYFVVMFQRAASPLRMLLGIELALVAVGAVLAGIAGRFGPELLIGIFGRGYDVNGVTLAFVVFSGGLVGMLCVAGAALLSRARHGSYSAGWVASAVVTIVALSLDFPVELRAMIALCSGPTVGLVTYLVLSLVWKGRSLASGAQPS